MFQINIIAKKYFHMAGLDDGSHTRQGWSKRSGANPGPAEELLMLKSIEYLLRGN